MVGFGRILVVDDNRFSRKNLISLLNEMNHVVDGVEGGEQALRRLESDHFDIVLTKLTMPAMDGWTLLESARNLNSPTKTGFRHLPVFLYTTPEFDPNTHQRALQAGFQDLVTKPVDPDRLEEVIRIGLGNRDDFLRIPLIGAEAALVKSLSVRFSMEPKELVTLLAEEVSLCGLDEGVATEEDLRQFLLTRLREPLLLLPGRRV